MTRELEQVLAQLTDEEREVVLAALKLAARPKRPTGGLPKKDKPDDPRETALKRVAQLVEQAEFIKRALPGLPDSMRRERVAEMESCLQEARTILGDPSRLDPEVDAAAQKRARSHVDDSLRAIEQQAEKLEKRHGSRAKALAEACKENPQLYVEYKEAMRKRAAIGATVHELPTKVRETPMELYIKAAAQDLVDSRLAKSLTEGVAKVLAENPDLYVLYKRELGR